MFFIFLNAFISGILSYSFKKVVSNAQGAQNRVLGQNPNVNLSTSNSPAVGRAVQNGAHIQPPLSGMFATQYLATTFNLDNFLVF